MLGLDTEPHPPEPQMSKPAKSIWLTKGNSIVGPNHFRQSMLLEETKKRLLRMHHGGGLERFAREEIACSQIHHRQRVAVISPASQSELPFEVGRPHGIRFGGAGSPWPE